MDLSNVHPHLIHGSLDPHESAPTPQNGSAVFAGHLVTNTDRETMLCVTSVIICSICAMYVVWPNNNNNKAIVNIRLSPHFSLNSIYFLKLSPINVKLTSLSLLHASAKLTLLSYVHASKSVV